jgi:apolipoprotein N-acyltransferase
MMRSVLAVIQPLAWPLLAGLLLALAFPRPDLAWFAWVALVPLFLTMERRPFASGLAAGTVFFAVVLYWLNIVMTTYGALHPILSVVAYLLLVLYLALFFAATTWLACRLKARIALPVVLALPIVWVALEYLRSFFLSGFPWATLGYSQQRFLPLIQSADLFGVYGISFLLVLSNATLALCWQAWRQRCLPRVTIVALTATALIFAGNFGYGVQRLAQPLEERTETLKVALIQGNIDQSIKWQLQSQKKTVEIYRDLSLQAARQGAELIVWPESATPFYFQDVGPLSREIRGIGPATGSQLLLGSPAYEQQGSKYRYLNSAFILSSQGETLGRSDKVHLVPFGEYVPFAPILPFIDKLVVGIGDFSPGLLQPLPMNGHRAGVLVCFEGIFPNLARDYIRRGSDLLVNITNDAWFGRSSAPYQHLAMSRFRAIENRVWLVRAANTGVSAFISPSGRIVEQSPLFETTFLLQEVGLGARPSLYTRTGDMLPLLFLLLSLCALGWTWRRSSPSAMA